jgi:hypothetical protein
MIPYKDPTSAFDVHGPATSLTPKIVSHGGGTPGGLRRVLKGNPVGWMQHEDGRYYPYLSARMEHSHQPVEHAMLNSVDLDHYGLGQVMPRRVQDQSAGNIRPSAQGMFSWPDTSVSSPFQPHVVFGGLEHPGGDYPAGDDYENDDQRLGSSKQQQYGRVQGQSRQNTRR